LSKNFLKQAKTMSEDLSLSENPAFQKETSLGDDSVNSGEFMPVTRPHSRDRSSRTPDVPHFHINVTPISENPAEVKSESKMTRFMRLFTVTQGSSTPAASAGNLAVSTSAPNSRRNSAGSTASGGGGSRNFASASPAGRSGHHGGKISQRAISRQTIAQEMLDIHVNFTRVLEHVIDVYVKKLENHSSCQDSKSIQRAFGALKILKSLEDKFITAWEYRLNLWCEDILLAEVIEEHLCAEEYKATFIDWYEAAAQAFDDMIHAVSGDLMLKMYFYEAHKKNNAMDLELFASFPSGLLQQILSCSMMLMKKTDKEHPDVEILQRIIAVYAEFSPKISDLMHEHEVVNPVAAVQGAHHSHSNESKN
jgi:hypothetical protein